MRPGEKILRNACLVGLIFLSIERILLTADAMTMWHSVAAFFRLAMIRINKHKRLCAINVSR